MDEFDTTEDTISKEKSEMKKCMVISRTIFTINRIVGRRWHRNSQKQLEIEAEAWKQGFEHGWKEGIDFRGRFTNKTWETVGGGA